MAMVRIVIANAFSVNMVKEKEVLLIKRITIEDARRLIAKSRELNVEIVSIVGHDATAQLLSELLNVRVPVNRVNYTYTSNDLMLVFSIGVRLPEGRVLTSEEIAQLKDKLNITLVVSTVEFPWGANIGFPARIDHRPFEIQQLLEEVGE